MELINTETRCAFGLAVSLFFSIIIGRASKSRLLGERNLEFRWGCNADGLDALYVKAACDDDDDEVPVQIYSH